MRALLTQAQAFPGKMPCPFGFSQLPDEADEMRSGDGEEPRNDRFNFDTNPVQWFYQNQIKSEEDFQARSVCRPWSMVRTRCGYSNAGHMCSHPCRKSELRKEARRRLDAVGAATAVEKCLTAG